MYKPKSLPTDLNILEVIAKYLGYTVYSIQHGKLNCADLSVSKKNFHWNPFLDDGDSARLMDKMQIDLQYHATLMTTELYSAGGITFYEDYPDKATARRYAVAECAYDFITYVD